MSHSEYCVDLHILVPHTCRRHRWLRRPQCSERNEGLQHAEISMSLRFFYRFELILVQISCASSDIRKVYVGDSANSFNSSRAETRCNRHSLPHRSISGAVPPSCLWAMSLCMTLAPRPLRQLIMMGSAWGYSNSDRRLQRRSYNVHSEVYCYFARSFWTPANCLYSSFLLDGWT